MGRFGSDLEEEKACDLIYKLLNPGIRMLGDDLDAEKQIFQSDSVGPSYIGKAGVKRSFNTRQSGGTSRFFEHRRACRRLRDDQKCTLEERKRLEALGAGKQIVLLMMFLHIVSKSASSFF